MWASTGTRTKTGGIRAQEHTRALMVTMAQ
jgi:hypothetical protein